MRREAMKRWAGALREPISIPPPSALAILHPDVPVAERAERHVYETQIMKLQTLRAQLGVDAWWQVALWLATRDVPGFKVAPTVTTRQIPWSQQRLVLYAEVNAFISQAIESGQECAGDPKAVDRAIARIKEIDPSGYRRHSGRTMRKQYYAAKAAATGSSV
jgi:hypothetical protein